MVPPLLRSRSGRNRLEVLAPYLFGPQHHRVRWVFSGAIVLWVCGLAKWSSSSDDSTAMDLFPLMGLDMKQKDVQTVTLERSLGEERSVLVRLLLRSAPTTESSAKDSPWSVAVGNQQEAQFIFFDRNPKKSCLPNTHEFSVRIASEHALVPIVLAEQQDIGTLQSVAFSGQFEFAVPGNYSVDFQWRGCANSDPQNNNEAISFSAPVYNLTVGDGMGQVPVTQAERPKESFLFAKSVWLSTEKLQTRMKDHGAEDHFPPYIWADPLIWNGTNTPDDDKDLLFLPPPQGSNETIVVSTSGTFQKPNGMYKFGQTGNYELVCFWGGPTMAKIRELFLAERKHVSSGQRPFKFHYYNITNMAHPDLDWTQSDKERCRKCKHIFLSLDDVAPWSSQQDFEQQFLVFIGHLQKLMNDPTFPIWILTFTTATNKNNCRPPYMYPRTTDHPCNDVLRQLVYKSPLLEPRVHLMDNADLVIPMLANANDDRPTATTLLILVNIAMRIFVAVGKGVEEWRAHGQQGLPDGLHRNGTVEPNFELVPYTGWAPQP